MNNKIRQLKVELQTLNDQFKDLVAKTKKQNDENHKIYDQNALINKLKVKVEKKTKRTEAENKANKNVISKLETFGYGYQKSFKAKAAGNLKRQISIDKKARAKSLIKHKDNYGIDYAVTESRKDKENLHPQMSDLRGGGSKKGELKKHKSVSKTRGIANGGAKLEKRRSKNLKKSKSNNIDRFFNDTDEEDKRGGLKIERPATGKKKGAKRNKSSNKK